jgi:Fatty acid desaturase
MDAALVVSRASAKPLCERRLMRHSSWDAVLVGLSIAHAATLLLVPSIPVVAVLLWWNANTVAHNFIHAPFFRGRALNVGYSMYLSAVLGIPQTLWRDRHVAHHLGQTYVMRRPRLLAVESGVVLALWTLLGVSAPGFFFGVYLPGYAVGLALCFLQGHYEHARGTTSHYGWLYNVCFFNDGYHVEHHRFPGEHWTRLPRRATPNARQSTWPPVLRWLDVISLETLERIVLRSALLQRYVLATHERALRTMLSQIPPVSRVTVVGGGLFPRTALILRKLLPEASLTIVERRADHIDVARQFLCGPETFRHEVYDASVPDASDLVVIPLAFAGDRRAIYRAPPAPLALVHDWIWNRPAAGVTVSWLLLKRLNLVTR